MSKPGNTNQIVIVPEAEACRKPSRSTIRSIVSGASFAEADLTLSVRQPAEQKIPVAPPDGLLPSPADQVPSFPIDVAKNQPIVNLMGESNRPPNTWLGKTGGEGPGTSSCAHRPCRAGVWPRRRWRSGETHKSSRLAGPHVAGIEGLRFGCRGRLSYDE